MKTNPRKICSHRSYSIEELSEALGICEKTLSRWIEQGLKTIPGCKKPILINGRDVREFMKNKKLKRKIPLNRNQFLCLACKAARYAKRGSTKVVGNKKTAVCRVCNGKMSRII